MKRKKIWGLLVLVGLLLLMVGCGADPGQKDGADTKGMSGEKTDDGAKVAIVLDIPEDSYEVGTAEIPYTIRNESGQPADVVMAPTLERKKG